MDTIKLLWIDDDLNKDLTERRMSLLMDDEIEADFATDATDAYYKLADKENLFDVVLFDLQHPSGPDDMWNEYRDRGERHFGLILLKMVRENKEGVFDHLANAQFGVLSIVPFDIVKEELSAPPIQLPESNFLLKTQALDDDAFIKFVKNLYKKL
jgi:hypothetical protein